MPDQAKTKSSTLHNQAITIKLCAHYRIYQSCKQSLHWKDIPLLLTQVCSCTPLSSIVVIDNQRPPVCSSSACCQHPDSETKTTGSMSENDGHMIFPEWSSFLHDIQLVSERLLSASLNVAVARSYCSDLNDIWSSHISIIVKKNSVSHVEYLFCVTSGDVAWSQSEKIKILTADGEAAALVLTWHIF